MIYRVFGFLFLYFLFLSIHGQGSERFFNLQRRDGLSSGAITSLAQDKQGLIWIGTKHGVNRYDGHDFKHYHTANSSIRSNDISSLLVDYSGNIWIGTNGGGLFYIESKTKQISEFKFEGLGETIKSIKLARDSSLWILSEVGLACISGSDSWRIDKLNAKISLNIDAFEFQGDLLWLGTSGGDLIQLDKNGSYISYNLSKQWPDIKIQTIYPVNDRRLFVGTRQYGLHVFDPYRDTFIRYSIDATDIRDVILDRNGAFWIGTDGQGIYKIKENKITNYTHRSSIENALISNAIQKCFEDRDGNLWFGSAWDGMSILDQRLENIEFFYSDFDGSNTTGVLSIYADRQNLWFGTDGLGLSIENKQSLIRDFTQILPDKSYIQFIDKIDKRYWIGTFQSGLYIIENKKDGLVKHYTVNSGLSHDDVRDVEKIGDDKFLIATWGGGLNLYDEQKSKFSVIKTGNKVPTDVVVLERINEDEILVGTYGQGLFVFKSSDLNVRPVLPQIQNIVSIENTNEGVWLGTWGEGLHLSQYPFTESKLIDNKDLPDNSNILSIISSRENENIWLSTNTKILTISPDFTVDEFPLASDQFYINAANIDLTGKLYFGSTDGVISFDSRYREETANRKVEILEVKILDKELNEFGLHSAEKELSDLEYYQNTITFQFSTPLYPTSDQETYEVKLEPAYPEWIELNHERSMNYLGLDPGKYEFKVRNATSQIEENFRFIIRPPLWKTWWAYSIYVFVFIGLLYYFIRYAISLEKIKNQLENEKVGREKESEINQIKQRFFVNVSHEIKTPLTLIVGEIEQLSMNIGDSKKIMRSVNNLQNNCNHLLELVNELLDFRKLDQGGVRLKVAQGNFVAFCKEIYLSFVNKADAMLIDYQFNSASNEIPAWYDRDQLEKVFTNLLSNAFKNTSAGGKIEMKIEQKETFIEVAICDNGRGIPAEEINNVFKRFYQSKNNRDNTRKGFGLGLSIVNDIIKLHHGTVSVQSEEGKGSSFSVNLRLGKDHFADKDLITTFKNSDSLVGYKVVSTDLKSEPINSQHEHEILIVEDNPGIRRFIRDILSSRFTVLEATNGVEAYEMMSQKLPDLIVSDVMMPEMDGITLTKKLKKHPSTSHIPVILLTARTETVFKKEGYETGADDYITKPFNSVILISRIENILKSRETLVAQIRNQLATRPDDLNLKTPDERFLKELVHVIQANIDNSELHAEFIASEMGMSHSVIYKKIKALTGLTLVEFVRDYRLQQAADILTKYKFSVAEACYKVGFSDKKYFSQVFKKKYGKTPSELLRS
ncbi:MAG: ATP-binding protein [Bacteroidota bacterium]